MSFRGADAKNDQSHRRAGPRLAFYIKYAEAFAATGLMINTPDDVAPVMKKAFDTPGPVIVGVHADYRDNHQLFEMIKGDNIH